MKFLKSKQDIIKWLNKKNIKDYEIIIDEQYGFMVNVEGNIDLSSQNLKYIEIKFNQVTGNFICLNNQLKSLEGCPNKVGGDFYCIFNNLRSLKFAPQQIDGDFDCSHNKLTSLEFCPQRVGGKFFCHENEALKDAQSITDFKAIYELHCETVIEKNYNELTQSLTVIEPVYLQNKKIKTKL